MTNKKISEFPEVATLGAEHFIPVVNELSFQNEKISKDNLITQVGGLLSISVSLDADQIKTGLSVPIDSGIPLPGVGKAIEVVSASIKYIFGTVAFTNIVVNLITDTATAFQRGENILNATASGFKTIAGGGFGSNSINIVENKRLMIQTNDDSATGDGTAIIYILFRIINI